MKSGKLKTLQIKHRIDVGLQNENGYDGDLKVFKNDEDVSDKIGEYDISGEGLKKILDIIDTF